MLAAEHPDKAAITYVKLDRSTRVVTWSELEKASNQVARLFEQHGVREKSTVVIGLRNSPEHYFCAFATWKLGAMVVPLRWDMPAVERDKVLELAQPQVVVGDWEDVAYPCLQPGDLENAYRLSDAPHPERISQPGVASTSGGSTGRPKLIVNTAPYTGVPGVFITPPGLGTYAGMQHGQTQLVAGPLYHGAPFTWGHNGLVEDHHLILIEKWDTELVAELIEKYRVQFMFMVPTMMLRLAKLPNIHDYDFSSLEALFHAGAKCPEWVKRFWIDLIGGEHVFESFGSTEMVGLTAIRGDEWLTHPGAVGRPKFTDIKILDADLNEAPTGEVGEIFMRFQPPLKPNYTYIGSPPAKSTPDGFISMGDMGWVDADGYLYSADRRVDMIISGGANVFPAEVEAALAQHPQVADVVVIGIPDDDWGRRVHAIIRALDPHHPPTVRELDAFCRERLMVYKTPKSYEFMEQLPRDAMGKIRRTALMAERENNWAGDVHFIREMKHDNQ